MSDISKKALLISVGGSPGPIVYSIKQNNPDVVIFFSSKDTQDKVTEIILQSSMYFKIQDSIVTSSPEDFNECFKILYHQLGEKMALYEITPENLIVDYTGGTKNMSAAMALATAEFTSQFCYVGGVDHLARSKGGVGVVLDGKEKVFYSRNPWDVMAIPARKRISTLFNKARYMSAIEEIKFLENRVTEPVKHLYESLQSTIYGFYCWDNFQYKKAHNEINKGTYNLINNSGLANEIELVRWAQSIKTNLLPVIEQINKDMSNDSEKYFNESFTIDLLSNAVRRANIENKYDDAAARLYSCIEHFAKVRLYCHYDKRNNSKLTPEQIPESIREKFINKYSDEKDKVIKIGLFASYELLAALDDYIGISFIERYEKEIKPLLNKRNMSPLAHGVKPVKKDDYDKLFSLTCELLNNEQLIQFPQLNL